MSSQEPILLIEDNPLDIENIKKALKATEIKYPLVCISTCEKALDFLSDRKNLLPWLILLGLNEQKSDDLNFLKTIKMDENLQQIPVIIFSFSNEQCNVVKSFKLGVAGYMIKSEDVSKLTETIKIILKYWTLSELPPVGGRFYENVYYLS